MEKVPSGMPELPETHAEAKERGKQNLLMEVVEKLQSRFGNKFSNQLKKDSNVDLNGLTENDLTPEALIEIAQIIEVLNNAVGWAYDENADITLEQMLDDDANNGTIEWIDKKKLTFTLKPGEMMDLVPNAHSGLIFGNGEDGTILGEAYIWISEGSRWSGLNNSDIELLKALRKIVEAGLPLHPGHISDIKRLEKALD